MEELIEKVRARDVLYNTNHPDYMKKALKESTWNRIAEELHYENGEQAKSLWLKLRNCHRDALRRKGSKTRNGKNSKKYKTWKYEPQMKFLLTYMYKTTTTANAQNAEAANKSKSKPENMKQEKHLELEVVDIKMEPETIDIEPEFTVASDEYEYMNESESDEELPPPTSPTKTYEEQAKEIAERRQTNDDELYHFFMSMYGMTKKLPLARQLKIKRRIFEIVAEEQDQELEHLNSF